MGKKVPGEKKLFTAKSEDEAMRKKAIFEARGYTVRIERR